MSIKIAMHSLSSKLGLGLLGLAVAVTLPLAAQAPAAGAQGAAARRGGGGGFTRAEQQPFSDNTGFKSLFNGTNLDGWKGRTDVWSVKDGAIYAQTTPENPTGTTNIWYTGVQPANFILKEQVKMVGNGNGGVQFRSANVPPPARRGGPPAGARRGPAGRGGAAAGARRGPELTPEQLAAREKQQTELAAKNRDYFVRGYQQDMDTAGRYTGQIYEQGTGRGIIAFPGDVILEQKGVPKVKVASLATPEELKQWVPDPQGWNNYEIIAQGHTLISMVNDHVIAILVDDDPTFFAAKGIIGMEIEGQNMQIYYKDIQLKELP